MTDWNSMGCIIKQTPGRTFFKNSAELFKFLNKLLTFLKASKAQLSV